ncbi:MAG: glycosyltransferase family 39 protein, partial [Bdellovibrionota bacterium]
MDRLLIWLLYSLALISCLVAVPAPMALVDRWSETYFQLLIGLIWLLLTVFGLKAKGKICAREALLVGAVFLGTALIRFFCVSPPPFWLDEHYQVWAAIQKSPVAAGYWQHQPPLEFSLINLFVRIAGASLHSARTSAVLFGALAPALVALLAWRIARRVSIAVLAAFLFAAHPIVEQFAWEARPFSAGFTGALLMVLAFERFLPDGTMEPPPHGIREWVYGTAAAILPLLVLGMQPVFFLFAISVSAGLCLAR